MTYPRVDGTILMVIMSCTKHSMINIGSLADMASKIRHTAMQKYQKYVPKKKICRFGLVLLIKDRVNIKNQNSGFE